MKTQLLYLCIAFQLLIPILAQGQKITGNLEYDFKTGHLTLDKNKPIGLNKNSQSPANRIFGLYQGQGVAIVIKNINPLKYYAQSTANFVTITTAPPALTALDVNSLFKDAAKPDVKADPVTAAPVDSSKLVAPKSSKAGKQPKPPVVVPVSPKPEIMTKLKGFITCIKNNIKTIEAKQVAAKELGKKFETFNNFYELMKTQDNLDETEFKKQIKDQFIGPLKALTATGYSKQLSISADITAPNLNDIKNDILEGIDNAVKKMDSCYDNLFDALLANPVEKKALQKEFKEDKNNMETDLMLSQLPETRKEYFKLQEWAKTTKETISDKLWPQIDKSLGLFIFCQNLSFEVSAGTVMTDEDIAEVTITIKSIADNKEIRKIDRIKFHTIGGFRMEYGVGLYVSGLSDDEYVMDRTTKIEKVGVLNGSNIDSVLQNVNYTTPRLSSDKNINWGAMTFFQARTNWGNWFNVGGYFGLGLLLNNNTKPIFSTGVSLVLGTIPRVSLNIGTAWGKVNRLNTKYNLNEPFKGDITDPTVTKTKSRLLIGLNWNLGKINIPGATASAAGK